MTDYLRHPDWLALLRGVCEEPDSDLRRLVTADCLDENGDGDRAEFIRVQVELFPGSGGQLGLGPPPARRGDLRVRAATLLAGDSGRNWRHWAGVAVKAVPPGALYTDHLTFRRGFVESVTLTAAAFLGGGCGGCGGSGLLVIHGRTHGDCLTCEGTGRTPGLAAAMFAQHPVTAVTLFDRHPINLRSEWEYAVSDDPDRRNAIPWRLFNLFPSTRLTSEQVARNALSRACVDYGRDLAGLTALAAGVPARPGRG